MVTSLRSRPTERSTSVDPSTEEGSLRVLFVPVNASRASERAVDRAIALARLEPAKVVLVDLLSENRFEEELALLQLSGAMQSTESGAVPLLAPAPLDEETRIAARLHQVLLPLQRHVEQAGMPVQIRLLHGNEQAAQFRAIVGETVYHAIILSDPHILHGSLATLTSEILAKPPCTVYLIGAAERPAQPARPFPQMLVRALWHLLTP